ncbi:OmpA/MotB family protein [Marinagarivorans algicola]|uniref:OmpA/MotB family protein n=1 Tax=Marinagarivorans algicola TaxID=1513270 RepID=UPI0037369363
MTFRSQQLTGPDRWQVSYADLLTLLLGFFIVMYAISAMESEEKEQVIKALQQSFISPTPLPSLLLPSMSRSDSQFFTIDMQGQWLYLTVASEALFDSGSASLTSVAKRELTKIAPMIAAQSGVVEVEGHTDNQPIHTERYASNWALSSARAVAVVDFFVSYDHGVQGERFRAVGFGQYSPIADNDLASGRKKNRRVVIKVQNDNPLIMQKYFDNKTHHSYDYSEGDYSVQPASSSSDVRLDNVNEADIGNTVRSTQDVKQILQQRLLKKGITPQKKINGGVKFSKD